MKYQNQWTCWQIWHFHSHSNKLRAPIKSTTIDQQWETAAIGFLIKLIRRTKSARIYGGSTIKKWKNRVGRWGKLLDPYLNAIKLKLLMRSVHNRACIRGYGYWKECIITHTTDYVRTLHQQGPILFTDMMYTRTKIPSRQHVPPIMSSLIMMMKMMMSPRKEWWEK